MVSSIAAVLFDADGVFQYPEANRVAQVAAIFGSVPEPFERFMADLEAAEETTLTGALEFLEVLPPVLARWGAPDKAQEVSRWLNSVTVDHEVLTVISHLRQSGYLCALATNQRPDRVRFMMDELNFRAMFDHHFFSSELGMAKPDRGYFRAVLAALRLAPERALLIDDEPANVEAARSLGIHAECFANPKNGRAQAELRELLSRFGVAC
jgi:putative hydrolase of the HAD superfamily